MNPENLPPENDAKLADFLNRNHPTPPPAPPSEFAQIRHAIETQGRRRHSLTVRNLRWWVPAMAAALLLGFVVSHDWSHEKKPHNLTSLRNFTASPDATWVYDEGSTERSPSEDWQMLADEINAQK